MQEGKQTKNKAFETYIEQSSGGYFMLIEKTGSPFGGRIMAQGTLELCQAAQEDLIWGGEDHVRAYNARQRR